METDVDENSVQRIPSTKLTEIQIKFNDIFGRVHNWMQCA